jgi:hypothetical protein
MLDLFSEPSYLEIGVQEGTTFHAVKAKKKIAVDPRFDFDLQNARRVNTECEYFALTSDAFFGSRRPQDPKFDVIYLDGLHQYEQTLRDVLNATFVLKDKGAIVIDDIRPSSYNASIREQSRADQFRRIINGEDINWMGDVYKLVYFIESFLQGWSYAGYNGNHGQLIMWRHPRPTVVERTMETVSALMFEHVLLEQDAYRWSAMDEIVRRMRVDLEL